MARYLIEADHDADTLSCARTVKIFLSTGSHYLTHAEWGCMDDVHTAWIIVEAENKEQALAILPPGERARAQVVALNRFSMDTIDAVLAKHRG